MANEEKNGKNVVTIDFALSIFPDVEGRRIESAKYSRDAFGENQKLKVVCHIPVPETDEDAQAIFNMPLQDLVALGVRQAVYGERFVTEFLVGKTDLTEDNLDKIRAEVETHLFKTEKAKTTSKDKVIVKKVKDSGMTPEQLEEAIAAYLKKNKK